MKKNYSKILEETLEEKRHWLSRHWKCCYAYILNFFLCSKIHISVFTCSYNMVPPQIFSATFLRFDQIGNKMQQPFRNQRQSLYGTQNVNITSNNFEHVLTISCNLKRTKSKLKKMFWQQLWTQTLDSQFSLRMW